MNISQSYFYKQKPLKSLTILQETMISNVFDEVINKIIQFQLKSIRILKIFRIF